ncbi:cleavage polyadenylation factor subunit MPE1 [Aspergillus homomorphus CBS 101889]|uniref:DWNN-domain-containing protein n=1 Tax=Aspergillus homomorphus (strain CBS 101889) TaxID=1450537 RepID=A0A395HIU5_ASPHC|nr:DWNN-domain-containing protein [Aspergillus homomorphus CBS 101889]RAL07556.1 DWNN-domain-containing protein [Aspergillus homomorphus CBS 101889]
MSSSVHFKFKSQKEPSRVTFDGTGISVFELKREIINQSRLGDGTDFELSVYNEDTGEEYDDDTSIIPRSTSVIARRLPASRPGKGGAARYVSGKMPLNARSVPRNEQPSSVRGALNSQPISNGVLELNNAQTEEEKINALFNLQAHQWKEQQQEMANATPVPFGRGRGKIINGISQERPMPPGYICYRCREKGHFIHECPTNNDPKFDGKYRVKRSTGIPRSLQTKVEKPENLTLDALNEDSRNTGVMVNADGDFVIAKPDKAAWELYQEKAKASAAAAAEAAAAERSKELQARGLECPIDKRMFLEPTKTPCCQKTYCNDCIANALIESDFVCPGCGTEGVLLDNLSVDDEAITRIKEYETEKTDQKKERDKQTVDQEVQTNNRAPVSGLVSVTAKESPPAIAPSNAPVSSKKRLADAEPNNVASGSISPGSSLKKQRKSDSHNKQSGESQTTQTQESSSGLQPPPFGQQMSFGGLGFAPTQGMAAMPFPAPGFSAEGPGFPTFLGMPPANAFPSNMNQVWNPMNGANFNQLPGVMYGDHMNGYGANMFGSAGDSSFTMFPMSQMNGLVQSNTDFSQALEMGQFANQQRTTFSTPFAREEDTAYFRQPVNPQRHQARHRRTRPSDYREL